MLRAAPGESVTDVVLIGGPDDGEVIAVSGTPDSIHVVEERVLLTRPMTNPRPFTVEGWYRATDEVRRGRHVYRWNGGPARFR